MGFRLPIVLTVLILAAAPARGAPESELWERWVAQDPASSVSLDHGPWDRFLAAYVVADGGVNRVAYGRVTPEDRRVLEDYIATLAATPADGLRRAAQLPFWINLYNALTVKVVLDHYPVQSIKDHRPRRQNTKSFERLHEQSAVATEGQELCCRAAASPTTKQLRWASLGRFRSG